MIEALNLVIIDEGVASTPPSVIVINGIPVNTVTGEGMEKLPPVLASIIRSSVEAQAKKLNVENPHHAIGIDAYETRKRKKLSFTGKVQTVQSLDLTAATDRLPVDLQAQILTILGYPGEL